MNQQRDLFLTINKWVCKMKLSKQTVIEIVKKLEEKDCDKEKLLSELDLNFQPQDASQSTLVILDQKFWQKVYCNKNN